MTTEEHQLIVEMFKEQTRRYAALYEVLKGRDLLSADDLLAADALVSASSAPGLEESMEEEYRGLAKILGVEVGAFRPS